MTVKGARTDAGLLRDVIEARACAVLSESIFSDLNDQLPIPLAVRPGLSGGSWLLGISGRIFDFHRAMAELHLTNGGYLR